jgi:glucose-6-phosphate isomerase
MEINFTNVNFEKDINLPENIQTLNNDIKKICNQLPALNIVKDVSLLDYTIEQTEKFKRNKRNFVVFGTGGSNLGARALINTLTKQPKNILFFDNIDPLFFQDEIINLDLNTTGFIIISKSGTTPETLSQFGSIINIAREKNNLDMLFKNCLVVTEFKDSPLFNIAKKNNCTLLEHKKDIGGRYSIFSNVGMIPAILAGLDVKKVHLGASKVIENSDFLDTFKFAQIFKFCSSNNYFSNVMMTYSDGLTYFGKWYLQLWAESIGKKNRGITALHAVGTTDQHSQLQLYLDGPKDKYFTFIKSNHHKKGLKIDTEIMKEESVNYLINKTMGDLMHAEQDATIDTFKLNNFKFREILLSEINEEAMGGLMANSIMETIAACIYFEVDPFDQPAVEQGKALTKKYLS